MIPLLEQHASECTIHWLMNETSNTDECIQMIPTRYTIHYFSESDIWTKRVGKCLQTISDEYVLFLHEDWLPINTISPTILSTMVDFMKKVNCGFLLSYSHISTTSRETGIFSGYENYYFYPERNHIFQPAIWKKTIFQEFCDNLNKHKNQNEDPECLQFMGQRNCWSVQNLPSVTTLRTTNSLFFPHMHALSEGLWNFTKYPTLKQFLESFGIDTSTRGVHPWWELDTQ
jgi:hypothetical protein